jgi:hypothetical protein
MACQLQGCTDSLNQIFPQRLCGPLVVWLEVCSGVGDFPKFSLNFIYFFGHAVTYLIEALCYKPDDRGFDSR